MEDTSRTQEQEQGEAEQVYCPRCLETIEESGCCPRCHYPAEDGLAEIIAEGLHGEPDVRRVRSFAEAGVLTSNEGLVVTMRDGREYQVTVVMSRRSR